MKTNNKNNKMTTIKKLSLVILLATLPLLTFAQSVFEKYEELNDVSTVVVTKQMFKLMGRLGGETTEGQEYKRMILGLDNLSVYSTESKAIASDMMRDVKKFVKSSKMAELVRVKDKDANVKIYVREGADEDHVSELFMFINSINNVSIDGKTPKVVVVSLTGNIDLNKISELSNKLNIPGGEHLKNAKH